MANITRAGLSKGGTIDGNLTVAGEIGAEANYIVNEQGRQDHVANTMPQPYYWFDGVDDYIDITSVSDSSVGVRDLTTGYVEALFRTGNTPSGMHVVCFGSTTGNTRNHMICTNGSSQLYVDLEIGNVRKYSGAGSTTLQSNTTYHVLFVHNGTTPKLYLNGVEETITFSITVDKTVWNDSNSNWNRGSICSHQSAGDPRGCYEAEAVYRVRFGNHVPSDAEIKELYSGASVPYKYKGANQTELVTGGDMSNAASWTITGSNVTINASSNGLLQYDDLGASNITQNLTIEKGKNYRLELTTSNLVGGIGWIRFAVISDGGVWAKFPFRRVSDDSLLDYTSWTAGTHSIDVYAVEDAAKIGFAFATTGDAGDVDNISLVRIGAVAEYDGSGASDTVWYDKSGNDLNGTVTGGATLENKLDTIQTSGITFPATAHGSSNANTLDDYEEGYFEGALVPGGGTITMHASYTLCSYTKIGRLVHVHGALYVLSVNSPTGDLNVTGLPFACASESEWAERSAGSLFMYGLNDTGGNPYYADMSSGTYMGIIEFDGTTNQSMAVHVKAGTYCSFSLTYHV